MTINNIIKYACDYIGLRDMKSYVGSESLTSEQETTINKLVDYFNRIQEEIATEYYSFNTKEEINSKEIYFSSLSKIAISIKGIKNKSGRSLKYAILTDHIEIDGTPKYIIYSYLPSDLKIGDELEYSPIPSRVLAYGIAREFYIEEGLRNEANMYEDKFKDALVNILKDKTNARIPCRKWL